MIFFKEKYKKELKNLTQENLEVESQKKWDVYDSGLVSGENPLEFDFLKLYPRGYKNIKDYLEKEYKKEKGKILGIELGGPGRRLFSDFSPGFVKESFGVTLIDKRNDAEKEEDQKKNHHVLVLDIFNEESYKKIKSFSKEKGFDLLFERMEGGWLGFPEDKELFEYFVFLWYELLANSGTMFIQSPYVLDKKNIEDWENWLLENKTILSKEFFDFVYEGGRFFIKIKKDLNRPVKFLI